MVDSNDYAFFPVNQISGNTGWNGNHSFDGTINSNDSQIQSRVKGPDVLCGMGKGKREKRRGKKNNNKSNKKSRFSCLLNGDIDAYNKCKVYKEDAISFHEKAESCKGCFLMPIPTQVGQGNKIIDFIQVHEHDCFFFLTVATNFYPLLKLRNN